MEYQQGLIAPTASEFPDVRLQYLADWDLHHGNGTQGAFYEDPDVLTISLHQEGLYPRDSGHLSERGKGAGEGYNINIPLPAGSGHGAYLQAFDRVVPPALSK